MAKTPEIKNLKEFLEPTLNGLKIVDYETKFLTAPGDNYGSTMLALTVNVVDENKKPQKLELVAKMRPASVQFIEVFQINITFVKECAIYTKVVPALVDLQIEMNVPEDNIINVFCNCYNGRISLSPDSDVVDDDALLVLENLKVKNFVTGDRRMGFDRETIYFILKDLAKFHAIPIALKYLKPTVFKEDVRKYLNKIDIDAGMGEAADRVFNVLLEDLNKIDKNSEIIQKIGNQMATCRQRQKAKAFDDCPFSTMVHNDFWVNNMMIAFDKNGRPEFLKMVDFQLIQYDSAIHDLLFFIITSANDSNLQRDFDEYLTHYYKCFTTNLEQLKCPSMENFTHEKFLDEVKRVAPLELYHIIAMLRVVMAKKESIPEHSELESDLFCNDDIVEEDYFEKLKFVVTLYESMNWV